MHFRRPAPLFYLAIFIIALPIFTMYLFLNAPDLTQEQSLQSHIVDLEERLKHAEMINNERREDLLMLKQQLNLLFSHLPQTSSLSSNASLYLGRGTLWKETPLFSISKGIIDLQLPSIYNFLPHLLNNPDSLQPSLKISQDRTGAKMVLGIPTVKREFQSYLLSTLENLIHNMSPKDKLQTVIVVLIAETDFDYVSKQADQIRLQFSDYLESGLLEVIAPPPSYYPDFDKLPLTLGDSSDRVKWRTKQNLDYSYLMMYSQPKGTFYVQLEDDILTKPGYIGTMLSFAYKQLSLKHDWIILDFCQLGFIGKMFKSVDLSHLVIFFVVFHKDKPVDWLLDHMVQTKVCRFDKDVKDCKKRKEIVWIHYKPSLFQHVGTHSSLKGKVQKLKDKQFGKVPLHVGHPNNPPAQVSTTLKVYRSYTLQRAYKGDTFFWGLLPVAGDTINFNFTPPIHLDKFFFRSGNLEHPKDRFYNTSVEILPVSSQKGDGYHVVGRFNDQTGIAEGHVPPEFGPIHSLRLVVEVDGDHWAILSEIFLQPFTSKESHASVANGS